MLKPRKIQLWASLMGKGKSISTNVDLVPTPEPLLLLVKMPDKKKRPEVLAVCQSGTPQER